METDISEVAPGEIVKWGLSLKPYIVAQSCKVNYSGKWICINHPTDIFETEAEKDMHISQMAGKHKLGWWCSQHEIERP